MKLFACATLKIFLIVVIAIPGVFFLKAIYEAPTIISGMSCDDASMLLSDMTPILRTNGKPLAESFTGFIFAGNIIAYLEKKETSPPIADCRFVSFNNNFLTYNL